MFWDRISGLYDFFETAYNGNVYRGLGERVAAEIGPNDTVLECACGFSPLQAQTLNGSSIWIPIESFLRTHAMKTLPTISFPAECPAPLQSLPGTDKKSPPAEPMGIYDIFALSCFRSSPAHTDPFPDRSSPHGRYRTSTPCRDGS